MLTEKTIMIPDNETMKYNIISELKKSLIEPVSLNLLIKNNIIYIYIEFAEKNIIEENESKIHDLISKILESSKEYENSELRISYGVKENSDSLKIKGDKKDLESNIDNKISNENTKGGCSSKSKLKKEKISLPGIKHIIMVASGKGGVGKSTISANLAIMMAKVGWRVGLLDADIYGASIPTIFDLENFQVDLDSDAMMIPFEKYNVKINSIEFITKSHEALIWRGPMLAKVLDQLLKNTAWGELDFLIVDTPPGTGDIHITLLENYEIDGYLLISTPHQTSINNSKKTKNMFDRFNVRNLGLVINMENIFSHGDISILDCESIMQIPMIQNHQSSLFVLEDRHEKAFIDICRTIVKNL
jgi:ATP-binding protein involved in chromosome partitioning